jgi:hypothetical protein
MPVPGAASSARTPRCSTALAQRGIEAGAVVVDREHDARAPRAPSDAHARPRPLAGVVEQVAEHLVEVLALAADACSGRPRRRSRAALGVEPQQRAGEPFGRLAHGAARGCGGAGGGARLREVVVHLAAHALDLLPQQRGELGVARAAARSASCASTASGVLRPWARSPALAWARATARSRCVEQRVQVVTSGWTSLG